jgi:hypothetical protein
MLAPNCLFFKKYKKAVDHANQSKTLENEFNPTWEKRRMHRSTPTNTGFKNIPNDLQPGGCCLKSFMSVFD